jgi:hypothetical protein
VKPEVEHQKMSRLRGCVSWTFVREQKGNGLFF